jgi:hypothetical protein
VTQTAKPKKVAKKVAKSTTKPKKAVKSTAANNSRELPNKLSLYECGVTDGATLRLVLGLRGGPIKKVAKPKKAFSPKKPKTAAAKTKKAAPKKSKASAGPKKAN